MAKPPSSFGTRTLPPGSLGEAVKAGTKTGRPVWGGPSAPSSAPTLKDLVLSPWQGPALAPSLGYGLPPMGTAGVGLPMALPGSPPARPVGLGLLAPEAPTPPLPMGPPLGPQARPEGLLPSPMARPASLEAASAPGAFAGVAAAGAGWTDVRLPDGSVVRREGTRAWRNNNPGNIEYGDFARSMGAVGTDGRFAVFPTYEAGRAAKERLLFAGDGYRGLSIGQAINRYAPPTENDSAGYAGTVAAAVGVPPDTPLSALTPQQRVAMLDAMERVEGFRPGTQGGTRVASAGGGGMASSSSSSSSAAPAGDWLAYANQNATRDDPLSPRLSGALSFLPELGVRMEVFSGGQEAAGGGGSRTGSTRHDHGNAADVVFYDAATGRQLDWSNPADVPRFQEIVRRARANGVTGFGAGDGYMRPGSMHLGFGSEAIWGASLGRDSAAPWLAEAVGGAPLGSAPPTGGQSMPQTISAMNAPEPQARPSLWDRLGSRPGLGWLADPARRAQIGLAIEGMRLDPNEALMQVYSSRIGGAEEDRRAGEQRQGLMDWLLQQPGGESFAGMIGAGFDPSGVSSAYLQSQAPAAPPAPTDDMREYDAAVAQGFQGTFADWLGRGPQADPRAQPLTGAQVMEMFPGAQVDPAALYNLGTDGSLSAVGGGGVTVNNEIGLDEGRFGEEASKLLAQNAMEVVSQGAAAQRGMGQLLSLEAALADAPQGAEGGLTLWASRLGIPVEGASEAQLADALINQLVPAQRPPGSGPMSDADLALFKQSLPALLNQPGGNAQILGVIKNVAQYDMARAEIAQRLMTMEITPEQAFAEYNALPHPIPAELMARLGSAPTAPVQGAPMRLRYDANGNRIEG